MFKVVCVPGTSAAQNLLQRGKRINERETSPTLFSASIDGRSDKLSDLRKSVASWLSSARINADGEAIVLATHEAAAGAIESGHQQFSVLGAIERDPGLGLGVNVAGGAVTHPAVAESIGVERIPVDEALGLTQTA